MLTSPSGFVPMIDVSFIQGDIDWTLVKNYGVQVAAVEIGVGNDQANPLRAAQVLGALGAGLTVVPYDFCFALPPDGVHINRDPVSQAKLFLQEMQNLKLEGRPIALDFEFPRQQDMQKWKDSDNYVSSWRAACLAEVEQLTGVTPWVYGSPDYLEVTKCADDLELTKYPLWIAHYGVASPTIPHPWMDFAAWQYTDKGVVPGVQTLVDLSWYRPGS
jgi:lysozyme